MQQVAYSDMDTWIQGLETSILQCREWPKAMKARFGIISFRIMGLSDHKVSWSQSIEFGRQT